MKKQMPDHHEHQDRARDENDAVSGADPDFVPCDGPRAVDGQDSSNSSQNFDAFSDKAQESPLFLG